MCLKFNRLLILVILYSLQCKVEGHGVFKKKIRKDQREFLCEKIQRNSIVNENALNSKVPSSITKCVLAIICSNAFSDCKGDQKKTVAIF